MKPFQSVDKKTGELRYGGQWLIKFKAPDGSWRRQVAGGTQKEAEAVLADIEYQIRHGQWVDPREVKREAAAKKSDCSTFGDIVDRFKEHYTDRSRAAQKNFRTVANFLTEGPIPAATPIPKLTAVVLQDAHTAVKTAPMALASRNLIVTYIKMLFRWAAKNPSIPLDSNPAEDLTRFKAHGTRGKDGMTRPVGKEEVFSISDVEKMREVALSSGCEALAHMFIAAINTGMRKGELAGLLWCNVDFERRQIRVCRNYERRGTKSGEERTVPMPGELLSDLRKWKASSPYSTDVDPVFPNVDGSVRKESFAWSEYVKRLVVAAGIARPSLARYGHATRHFFATQWLLQGGSDVILARILGHADTMLIHRTYSHFTNDDLVEAMDRIKFSVVTKPVTIKAIPGVCNSDGR